MLKPRLTGLLTLVAIAITVLIGSPDAHSSPVQSNPPNIVLINLDDADMEMFDPNRTNPSNSNVDLAAEFPSIMDIATSGISFTNMHVTTPLCGPSRACFYSAMYAHRTRIKVNQPGGQRAHGYAGDFAHYVEEDFHLNDLSVWMHNANYRTMMVGKYIHQSSSNYESTIPSSWDDFYHCHGNRYYGTFVYSRAQQPEAGVVQSNQITFTDPLPPNNSKPVGGQEFWLGYNPGVSGVYRTNFERDVCVNLIQKHIDRNDGKPFFLNVNPYGPHSGNANDIAMYHPAFAGSFPNANLPVPLMIGNLMLYPEGGFPTQTPLAQKSLPSTYPTDHYRDRMRSIKSINYLIGSIKTKLQDEEILDNTYIILTSDNGFSLGHHNTVGKGTPTNRSSKVPFFISGPGVQVQNTPVGHLLGHIDIAPTIADLAGALPQGIENTIDGKSFASLVTSANPQTATPTRTRLLIENWETLVDPDNDPNNGIEDVDWASTTLRLPPFSGPVDHTGRSDLIYTEWANGDRDFFNLANYPEQEVNEYQWVNAATIQFFQTQMAAERFKGDSSVAPEINFTVPHFDGQVVTGSELMGYAEDPVGVDSVKYIIFNATTGKYWDPNSTSWTNNSTTQYNAVLENQGGFITRWKTDIPTNVAANDQLVIFVWAYDGESPPQYQLNSMSFKL